MNLKYLLADYSHIRGDKIVLIKKIFKRRYYLDNFELKDAFDKLRNLRKEQFEKLELIQKVTQKSEKFYCLNKLKDRTDKIRDMNKCFRRLEISQLAK